MLHSLNEQAVKTVDDFTEINNSTMKKENNDNKSRITKLESKLRMIIDDKNKLDSTKKDAIDVINEKIEQAFDTNYIKDIIDSKIDSCTKRPVYEQYAGPLVIDRQLVNKTSNFSEICDLLVIYIIQIYNKL